MINKKFEAYKINREIKKSGIVYEFKRSKVNEFNEPTDEFEVIGELKGIYHEQNSSVQIIMGDTTQTRTKKIPMILCLYDDAANLLLKVDDIIKINGKVLKVTGITNIQEWNIIADISLEVVDNGF